MHRFKSAILAIFHFCQNGTFEPVHEIQISIAVTATVVLNTYEFREAEDPSIDNWHSQESISFLFDHQMH